jgi:hypothetical protein
MSDWDDILKEVRALQAKVAETPILQTTVQQTLDAILTLLVRMALRMELQHDPVPRRPAPDDLQMNLLMLRLDSLENQLRLGFHQIHQALDQHFDAVNKALAEVRQSPPEAPQGFDE